MHSSRMRTGRSLTVCCSLLPGGGVCSGGVPGPGGGAWSRGVSALRGLAGPGGICSRGGLLRGGRVPGPGGYLLWGGVCSWGGIKACTEADTPPTPHPVDRHTLVKILPWPNFVAAGNNDLAKETAI